MFSITYADAKRRYPKEVAKIVSELNAHYKRKKIAAPSANKLKWFFSRVTRVDDAGSILEILSQDYADKRATYEKLTPEEKALEQLDRTSCGLRASIGRWKSKSVPVENPKEIHDKLLKMFRERQAEQERFNKLSDDERQKETNNILAQLQKSGGFGMFASRPVK
jgi:glutamyl/glutaminyl-tRNA synthetase